MKNLKSCMILFEKEDLIMIKKIQKVLTWTKAYIEQREKWILPDSVLVKNFLFKYKIIEFININKEHCASTFYTSAFMDDFSSPYRKMHTYKSRTCTSQTILVMDCKDYFI